MSGPLRVILATGNAGKAREFARLLGPWLAVESMPDSVSLPPETGHTFGENARLKAQAVAEATERKTCVLADDSGLEVEALGGSPGVLSARYAGEEARDEDNVAKLLAGLQGVTEREARFVCALCLVLPAARASDEEAGAVEVEGVLRGQIALEPRGSAGFGYDPVFEPEGWASTLAQAAPEDKDRVSHRGDATRKLLQRLTDLGVLSGIGSRRDGH